MLSRRHARGRAAMLKLGSVSGGHRTFHAPRDDGVLLELSDVVVSYSRGALALRQHDALPAVGGVSLSVKVRESVGLVGESGSGKTSLGRSIMRLAPLTSGRISVVEPDASDATGSGRAARRLARSVQIIFQDPYSSLDPRHSVERIISDAMRVHRLAPRSERSERTGELLERVGLPAAFAQRYPHELSGGQRQRVCIARALAVRPQVIICDEPTSALDVSIQAQVIELLQDLQQQEDLTFLFITHDLALLPQLVSDVAVMYLGRLVEVGPTRAVLDSPRHPYTVSLVSAAPVLGQRRVRSTSRLLKPDDATDDTAAGCSFRPRCWLYPTLDAEQARRCEEDSPALDEIPVAVGRRAACHFEDLIESRQPAATTAPQGN